jgi:hypothetical protein
VDESGNYAWHFPVLSNPATVIYISISLDLTALSIKVQTFETAVPIYAAHPSTLRPWFYLTIVLPKTSVGRFPAHQ